MKTAKKIFLNFTCKIKNAKNEKKTLVGHVKLKSFTYLTCQFKPDITVIDFKNA